VASPFIAGLYARAPKNPAVLGPNTVYSAPATAFNDVVIGTNAGLNFCVSIFLDDQVCDAGPGWDGPTGGGTPHGLTFTAG
jgi:hypothetical protein